MLENLFKKYGTDPAIEKLRKKIQEQDEDKDLGRSLFEQWKNMLNPSPMLQ